LQILHHCAVCDIISNCNLWRNTFENIALNESNPFLFCTFFCSKCENKWSEKLAKKKSFKNEKS